MLNIIWVIVDSVRNYACPADRVDDRGRIPLMDELADEWIDFRTVVTAASVAPNDAALRRKLSPFVDLTAAPPGIERRARIDPRAPVSRSLGL